MDLSHALHLPKGLSDPVLWIILALFIFIGILFYFKIHKKIAHSLDDRAKKIAQELDEARRLREQAQEELASYQRLQREAEKEAQGIIAQAQKEAKRMAQTLREKTKQRLEKRIEMAETRIAYAEQEAIRQIRNMTTDLALDSIKKLLQEKSEKNIQASLLKKGIDELSSTFN